MSVSYTVVGPVTKKVTKPVNKPGKDPKPSGGKPDAPSSLTATAASSSQIDLAWTDNSSDETGFELQRSPNGTNGWTEISTPATDATSDSDTGLTAETEYFYRVRAVKGGKKSQWSNTDSATTPAATPATAVVSVELVSTAFTGTSTTVNLTKGQDYTQCVPFLSYRANAQNNPELFDRQAVRAELIDNSGTPAVRFTRGSSSSIAFTIRCYIVEFSDDVRVQQISFSTSAQNGTAACTAVDLSKAFVLANYSSTYADSSNQYHKTLLVKFNSSTQLGLRRGSASASATLTGTAYVVEDVSAGNTLFSVQTFSGSGSSVADFDSTISSIDTAKTSIICSHHTAEEGLSDHGGASIWARLTSATNVRISIPLATSARTWEGYAVTWLDGSTVQRGTYNEASPASNALDSNTVAITAVNETKSIAYITTRHWDVAATSDGNSYNAAECKFAVEIQSGGSNITLAHWSTVFALTHRFGWEVVTFEI